MAASPIFQMRRVRVRESKGLPAVVGGTLGARMGPGSAGWVCIPSVPFLQVLVLCYDTFCPLNAKGTSTPHPTQWPSVTLGKVHFSRPAAPRKPLELDCWH